jgi:hypothetical protein
LRKDADTLPRFNEDRPARERYLLGQIKQLKEGEPTEMLEDATNRANHLVVMQKIEPGTIDRVARRELMKARNDFARERASHAVFQSFSLDALRKGWGYKRADGEKPDEAKSAKTASDGGAKPAASEGGAAPSTSSTGK